METVNTDSAGGNSASATPSTSNLMVTWKKKNRKQQFPVIGLHFAEWVDRANEEHIQVTYDVLRITNEELISILPTNLTTLAEDYTDFNISNGWLNHLPVRRLWSV